MVLSLRCALLFNLVFLGVLCSVVAWSGFACDCGWFRVFLFVADWFVTLISGLFVYLLVALRLGGLFICVFCCFAGVCCLTCCLRVRFGLLAIRDYLFCFG